MKKIMFLSLFLFSMTAQASWCDDLDLAVVGSKYNCAVQIITVVTLFPTIVALHFESFVGATLGVSCYLALCAGSTVCLQKELKSRSITEIESVLHESKQNISPAVQSLLQKELKRRQGNQRSPAKME